MKATEIRKMSTAELESKLAENSVQVTQRIQMGPVVGTHAGPEAFGIIYIRK